MNRPVVDAVVFDMDGLLVDSEPVQMDAWHRFVKAYGATLKPELLSRLYGLRVWDTARVLIDELDLPLTVDQVVEERDAIFFSLLPGRLGAMPDAVDTVRRLKARQTRLALATSGHRRYVDVVLDELDLRDAFEIEVTGDMVEHGKPSPDIYLLAARKLGIDCSACVALEDAPNGIASAKSAGMICLAVPNLMTANIAGFERADAILGSLSDVILWLDRETEFRSHGPVQ